MSMKDKSSIIAAYFPNRLRLEVKAMLDKYDVQELRVRVNRPLQIVLFDRDIIFSKFVTNDEDCKYLFESFCRHSVYACEEDIRNGYITLSEYGIRVGISGTVLEENNKVIRFKNIGGFCIRIPNEIMFCSSDLCKELQGLENSSLIVASPPASGKTTLLRDIARELSDTYMKNVCIIDERSELAGCFCGISQFNVGIRTDVIDNCNKKDGMLMAIRTLSPNVLICDELGTQSDFDAAVKAVNSGISIAVSVHAADIKQIKNNSAANQLLKSVRYVALLKKSGIMHKCFLFDNLKNEYKEINISRRGEAQ